MAAPTVRGSTAPVTGLSTTSPAGTQEGDLVVCATWERAGAGSPTHTVQTGNGFTEIRTHAHDDGSTDGRLSCAYKIATSSGAVAYQAYTTSGSGTVYTGCIVYQKNTFNVAAIPTSAADSGTTNAAPNSPQVASLPSGGYEVLTIAGWHLGSAATVAVTAPTNYAEVWEIAGSADVEFSMANRAFGVGAPSSEDPGAFADDVAPNGTARMTIAIFGGSGVSATPEIAVASAAAVGPTVTLGAISAEATPATATPAAVDPSVSINTSAEATPAVASAAAVSPDVTVGALSVEATPANASSAAVSPDVTMGGISVEATLASTAPAAVSPDVTLGGLSVEAGVAAATAAAIDPDVENSSNEQEVEAGIAVASSAAVSPTITLGGVSAEATPAVATCAAVSPDVSVGGISIEATLAAASSSAISPDVTLGGIESVPDPATASALAIDPGVSNGLSIEAGIATVSPSAVDPTVTLGGVEVTPSPAFAGWIAVDPSVTFGGIEVELTPVAATFAAVDPSVENYTAGTYTEDELRANPKLTPAWASASIFSYRISPDEIQAAYERGEIESSETVNGEPSFTPEALLAWQETYFPYALAPRPRHIPPNVTRNRFPFWPW